VQSDNQVDVTVSNFDNIEIQTRGEGPSNVDVNNALEGMIDTGEGDDVVTLNVASSGADNFYIKTDGGDDTINLDGVNDSTDHVIFSANAGEGTDDIYNFNTDQDILRFEDVLDGGDGLDQAEIDAFTDSVTVTVVDGTSPDSDLLLEIPDQTGGGGDATFVTLANVAVDYGDFASGGSLTDLIETNEGINVETYAS